MEHTRQTAAVEGGVPLLDAGATIEAGRGAAGCVGNVAVLAGELRGAAAVVRAHFVHAHAAVEAQGGDPGALVHVLLASLTVEGRWASADVGGVKRRALATIGTWVGGTRVSEVAHFTFREETIYMNGEML